MQPQLAKDPVKKIEQTCACVLDVVQRLSLCETSMFRRDVCGLIPFSEFLTDETCGQALVRYWATSPCFSFRWIMIGLLKAAIKCCVLSASPLPPPLVTCLAAMVPHDGLAGSSCGVESQSSHLEITGNGRIYLLPHQDHPLQSPPAPRRDSNDGHGRPSSALRVLHSCTLQPELAAIPSSAPSDAVVLLPLVSPLLLVTIAQHRCCGPATDTALSWRGSSTPREPRHSSSCLGVRFTCTCCA